MEPWLLAALAAAGVLAGFIDSVVGGGGVITLPALLATGMPAHTAIATNKVAGTGASSIATWQYARHGLLRPKVALAAFPVAVLGSVLGARTVLDLPALFIETAVVVMMVAIVAYVLLRPRFGAEGKERAMNGWTWAATLILALVVGFYDGMLGPGTGTLLLFGLVAIHAMPFLPAAAHGRLLNFGSNLGALVFFALAGPIDWGVGLVMAAGTVTGGFLGSRWGVRHGSRWVRRLFVAVAVVLVATLLVRIFAA